ncbi:MAG: hypothetical protein KGM17_03060 [Sphingomonadales bacterium]|nr:hypothetical protein [Sphingomonadales bacterium]
MITSLKKTALKTIGATALAATALASATPAMADPYRRHGSDVAGPAIAAGIFGLAIGAIIASSSHHDRDREYRGGYYDNRYNGYGAYPNGAPRGYAYDRDGYRYDGDGRPYGYDRHERRGW